MRKFAIALAAILLTGCFHSFHELGEAGTGAVGIALEWDNAEDASTPLHGITASFWGDGAAFSKEFSSIEDVAGAVMQLPAGEYDVLVMANMTLADGYIVQGIPATRAAAGDVTVSLRDPASSPRQAWFGFKRIRVPEGGISLADIPMRRLLPTVDMEIANLPAGTAIEYMVSSVAGIINLTAKDTDGKYGMPGDGSDQPSFSARTIRLMPTGSGISRIIIILTLTTPDGNTLTVTCDAPRTDIGKTYSIQLDYNTLRPYMYFDSAVISPWEDGWTVSGEILNPQNK